MGKKKGTKSSTKIIKKTSSIQKPIINSKGKVFLGSLKNQLGLIIAIFAFALYAQSISFSYTFDDYLIIDNPLVKKGISAIPVLIKTDQAFGLNDENLRVLTYRPVPLVLHAIQWQFFPDNPHFYHLINVLLYSLICWLLFILLCKLFENHSINKLKKTSLNIIFPFIAVLLYSAHPIHTEVVDSIKSQDELMCFLFSILSIFLFLKAEEKNSLFRQISATLLFALALFSKESAIVYIVIIPLILFVFTDTGIKRIITIMLTLAAVSVVFLFIHFKVLESITQDRINMLHTPYFNSLVATSNFIIQRSTAFYILLKYILLLIFPYQMSYDYSIAQIPLQQLSNPIVIFSVLLHLALAIYAIIRIRKKDILAFGILFYLITLSPVSNIFLLINCTMADRFLFMPSLGFCLVLALVLIKLLWSEKNITNLMAGQLFKTNARLFLIVLIIAGLFAGRTIGRNPDWKDKISLYSHDVKIATNSSRAHFCYGSVILNSFLPIEKDATKKIKLANEVITEYDKAIAIYPYLPPIAYARLGAAYGYLGDYKNVISYYEMAILKSPVPSPFYYYNDLGMAFSMTNQFDKALCILDSSIKYYPADKEAYIQKSFNYLQLGKFYETIAVTNKILKLDPNNALGYLYAGYAYLNLKQFPEAIKCFSRGSELDPNNTDFYKNMGLVYQQMGDSVKAKQYFEKANQLRN